eukprot:10081366-Heterocapsa_arctica.AAC.1
MVDEDPEEVDDEEESDVELSESELELEEGAIVYWSSLSGRKLGKLIKVIPPLMKPRVGYRRGLAFLVELEKN